LHPISFNHLVKFQFLNWIQICCMEFKFYLIFTKPIHFFHQFIVTGSARECRAQVVIMTPRGWNGGMGRVC
jgi:hypothetical protein